MKNTKIIISDFKGLTVPGSFALKADHTRLEAFLFRNYRKFVVSRNMQFHFNNHNYKIVQL